MRVIPFGLEHDHASQWLTGWRKIARAGGLCDARERVIQARLQPQTYPRR